MNIAPITSWTEYVRAVKQMREYQQAYFKLKSQIALGLAKAWEAAVDEATGRKIAEWDGQKQIIGGEL
jgi:hypothetical protein